LATCYHVRGLGLVVIASCSHRGVLNSVRRAQAVSGVERIHAVVGGFHLVRFSKEHGDMEHRFYPTLDEPLQMFLLLRQAYALDAIVKRRVK
jgi:hypothetical protein